MNRSHYCGNPQDFKIHLLEASPYGWEDRFDFLVTSYQIGYEKPDSKTWLAARGFVNDQIILRFWQRRKCEGTCDAISIPRDEIRAARRGRYTWIHIGDDLEIKYEGAESFGYQALFLDRDGHHK
jgi:hypothetical protein